MVGGEVCGLPLYPPRTLQVSFATTSVASLPVCVCLFVCFLRGRGGDWWGKRRQLNLPGVFTIRRRLHTSANMRM